MVSVPNSGAGDEDILRDVALHGQCHYGGSRAQLAFHTAESTLFRFVQLTKDSWLS